MRGSNWAANWAPNWALTYAAICFFFAVRAFKNESIMF